MKIEIPRNLKMLLDKLVADTPDEFTLFGKGEVTNEGARLVDVYVPKQKSTLAHTEAEHDAQEEFLEWLVERGENPADWFIWLHSHNTMSPTFSSTDEEQISKGSLEQGFKKYVAIVMSTKGYNGAVMQAEPWQMWENNVPVVECEDVELPLTDEEKEGDRERAEAVKTATKELNKVEKKMAKLLDEVSKLEEDEEEKRTALEEIQEENPFYERIAKELKEKNEVEKPKKWASGYSIEWGRYDDGFGCDDYGSKTRIINSPCFASRTDEQALELVKNASTIDFADGSCVYAGYYYPSSLEIEEGGEYTEELDCVISKIKRKVVKSITY